MAVTVSGDRRSFIYIERMVVYQRDDARRLREHKEASTQARSQQIVRTNVMGFELLPAASYASPPQSVCGKHVTERNYFSPASVDMRRRQPAGLGGPGTGVDQFDCDEAQVPRN